MATKEAVKKEEVTFKYDDADVEKGAKIIDDRGYITKKDFPKMDNALWSAGFEKKIDEYLLNKDESHYMYFEKFDFAGGTIENIIFDMDKIKTRTAALNQLGETLDLKVFGRL